MTAAKIAPTCTTPWRPPDGSEVYPIGPGGYESCWRTGRVQFEKWDEEGMIEWKQDGDGQYKPYVKYYLEGRTKQVSNYWDDIEGNKKASRDVKDLLGDKVFSNPKPVGLVKKILQIATHSDSLVLDFFSGSSTTAHAVMQLNAEDGGARRHIQVQLPEPTPSPSTARSRGFNTIPEIARARAKKAGEKILQTIGGQLGTREKPLDVGFRAFKLSDTNFAKWRLTSDVVETELEQHLLNLRESADDEASQEALLTELLLKRGYSLTEQVDVFDVAGLEIHGVKDAEGDYGLLAYLNERQKPTLEQLRALVDAAEAQIVILEDAFQGDDQLKTNLAQLCKSKGIELWTA